MSLKNKEESTIDSITRTLEKTFKSNLAKKTPVKQDNDGGDATGDGSPQKIFVPFEGLVEEKQWPLEPKEKKADQKEKPILEDDGSEEADEEQIEAEDVETDSHAEVTEDKTENKSEILEEIISEPVETWQNEPENPAMENRDDADESKEMLAAENTAAEAERIADEDGDEEDMAEDSEEEIADDGEEEQGDVQELDDEDDSENKRPRLKE